MIATNIKNMTRAAALKNCFRCGKDFRNYGRDGLNRICPSCRKPRLPHEPKDPAKLLGRPLTVRERQIVRCVCEGKLNKEIAHQLHLAEGTVKAFMSTIFSKVGVSNRTALAIWALRQTVEDESA
jgi:DNA-binding NarL/FixJ family response regulator